MGNMKDVQKRRMKFAMEANAMSIKENQKDQKFPRGAKVLVQKGSSMSYSDEFNAIICFTYAQKYWGDDINSYCVCVLDKNDKIINRIAWIYEEQMTLINSDIEKGILMLNKYSSGA